MTSFTTGEALQVLVLAALVARTIIDWVYGPSRLEKIEKSIVVFREEASARADFLQVFVGKIEVKLAEDAKDHTHYEDQFRTVWKEIERLRSELG